MILERSMSPEWLSNTYLVGDRPGGHAVLVDAGGPAEPILDAVRTNRLVVTHLLCTHHHHDHVAHNERYARILGCRVLGHRDESGRFGRLDGTLSGGETIRSGDLSIRTLHIPGHTVGQLAYLVDDATVFTGDTLFSGSVGGTRAPGHGTFEQLKASIMEVLMRLPEETAVMPGHTEATSIGKEWDTNPFIRAWRGVDRPAPEPCVAAGTPATLLLRATDYDGGTKCWVRFPEEAREEILPGSVVLGGP